MENDDLKYKVTRFARDNNGKKSHLLLHSIPDLAQKSMDEIVIIVNNHFATICQTYPPYNDTVTHDDSNDPDLELISEHHTYYLLKKYSKKSLGPDDFPRKIISDFAAELAFPFCNITNCALMSTIFLDAFKISEIVPIPKENPPKSTLRSSTHF